MKSLREREGIRLQNGFSFNIQLKRIMLFQQHSSGGFYMVKPSPSGHSKSKKTCAEGSVGIVEFIRFLLYQVPGLERWTTANRSWTKKVQLHILKVWYHQSGDWIGDRERTSLL